MPRAIIVTGRLSDPRHIELDAPVAGIESEVDLEVALKVLPRSTAEPRLTLAAFLAELPAGSRAKRDIDRQVAEDRDAWDR